MFFHFSCSNISASVANARVHYRVVIGFGLNATPVCGLTGCRPRVSHILGQTSCVYRGNRKKIWLMGCFFQTIQNK